MNAVHDDWDGEVESLLLDQIDAAVIALDLEGRITHWNAHAEALYGWSRDEVLGCEVRSTGLMPAGDGEADSVMDILKAGLSWEGDFGLQRKDGTRFLAFVKDAPLRCPSGRLIGYVGVSVDVTERRRTEQALRESEQARRALLAQLVTAQDDERRRFAADIHDYAIQVLHAAVLRLEALTERLTAPDHVDRAGRVDDALRSAIVNLRSIVAGVRLPGLDGAEFVPALEAYLEAATADWPIQHRLECHVAREPLPEVRAVLFRVVVEAVANARRHSGARTLKVSADSDDAGVGVTIVDDGEGFIQGASGPREVGHYGIATMKERAELAGGWLRVESKPGDGTSVEAWVPHPVTPTP